MVERMMGIELWNQEKGEGNNEFFKNHKGGY